MVDSLYETVVAVDRTRNAFTNIFLNQMEYLTIHSNRNIPFDTRNRNGIIAYIIYSCVLPLSIAKHNDAQFRMLI